MNIESCNNHGNKVLVTIPPVGHLKYDTLKENFKCPNFVNQGLDAL